MDKIIFDCKVEEVCNAFNWVTPEPWCYPGDLIFDTTFQTFLICGDNPKDVGELRRRNRTYLKVNIDELKQFLIDRTNRE